MFLFSLLDVVVGWFDFVVCAVAWEFAFVCMLVEFSLLVITW